MINEHCGFVVVLLGGLTIELSNKTWGRGIYMFHEDIVYWGCDLVNSYTVVSIFGPPRASCHGDIQASCVLGWSSSE